MTALHRNSKADTQGLYINSGGGGTDLLIDVSQWRANLSNGATLISTDQRLGVRSPREISMTVDLRNTFTGVLFNFGNVAGTTYNYRLSIAAGVLTFGHNNAALTTVAPTGISASSNTFVIHWATRLDPGGVTYVSEIAVYSVTSAAWVVQRIEHTEPQAPAVGDQFNIRGYGAGVSLFSGGFFSMASMRVSSRFHSTTEGNEDGVLESTPATSTGYDRSPFITGPSAALAIASEANLCGPSLLWAGAATRQAGQRGVGPLVNVSIRSPNIEETVQTPTRFYRDAPDGGGWQWCVRYLWHAYVGPKVNVAQVRIHLRAYDIFGGGATISPISFRAYSVADLPLAGSPTPLTYYRGPVSTVSAVSSAGVWVDLGVVRLARDAAGLSYFVLGFSLAPAANEGVTFFTTWKLNAIVVEPFAKDLAGGGMGGDLDKETP